MKLNIGKLPISKLRRLLLLSISAMVMLGSVTHSAKAAPPRGTFEWSNLDSSIAGAAIWRIDDLINSWGVVPGSDGDTWVCANGTGLLTRFDNKLGAPLNDGTGGGAAPFPAIPIQPSSANIQDNGADALSAPTGIVLNHRALVATGTSGGFINPNTQTEAWLLMASEDGAVSAFSPVISGSGRHQLVLYTGTAAVVIDNSGTGAVYKGLALSITGTDPLATSGPKLFTEEQLLYVANFNSGQVEVYNKDFNRVNTFTDPTLSGTGAPTLPDGAVGWAPFNIVRVTLQTPGPRPRIQRLLLVSFAAQNAEKHDDVAAPGAGFIDVFDTQGNFILRLVDAGGDLNSPWGMAFARDAFGDIKVNGSIRQLKNALIVGNFGDGGIHAYDLTPLLFGRPATPLGALKTFVGQDLAFDGAWGLHFGRVNDNRRQIALDQDGLKADFDKLFFAAGPVGESTGLMGRISPH